MEKEIIIESQKPRNTRIDFLRGFAAILVVYSHIMQNCKGYEDNLLYNIIFSIQMPLFMMISGYTTTYSKEIITAKDLLNHIKRRCKTLLLPWISWCLLRFMLTGSNSLLDYIKYSSMHMENAFWFLFSLWTIDMIFSISTYLTFNLTKHLKLNKFFVLITLEILLNIPLLIIGIFKGITFLSIKYTLYYTPFYLLGFFYNKYKNGFLFIENNDKVNDMLCFLMGLAYIFLIHEFKVFEMPDSGAFILIRLIISTTICLIIFELTHHINNTDSVIFNFLKKLGTISLEIYVVHSLILNWLNCSYININTVDGFVLSLTYFIIMVSTSLLIIKCISAFKYSNLILFGKNKKY